MNLTPSETVTSVPSENMFSVYGRMTALPGQRDELIWLVTLRLWGQVAIPLLWLWLLLGGGARPRE